MSLFAKQIKKNCWLKASVFNHSSNQDGHELGNHGN